MCSIKASNFLVDAGPGGSRVFKLADWGLAEQLGANKVIFAGAFQYEPLVPAASLTHPSLMLAANRTHAHQAFDHNSDVDTNGGAGC